MKNLQREEDKRQIDHGIKNPILITPDRLHKKRACTEDPSTTPTKKQKVNLNLPLPKNRRFYTLLEAVVYYKSSGTKGYNTSLPRQIKEVRERCCAVIQHLHTITGGTSMTRYCHQKVRKG